MSKISNYRYINKDSKLLKLSKLAFTELTEFPADEATYTSGGTCSEDEYLFQSRMIDTSTPMSAASLQRHSSPSPIETKHLQSPTNAYINAAMFFGAARASQLKPHDSKSSPNSTQSASSLFTIDSILAAPPIRHSPPNQRILSSPISTSPATSRRDGHSPNMGGGGHHNVVQAAAATAAMLQHHPLGHLGHFAAAAASGFAGAASADFLGKNIFFSNNMFHVCGLKLKRVEG